MFIKNNSSSIISPILSFSNFLLIILLISSILFWSIKANDDNLQILGNTQFFRRNAKWSNLPSGGGSLVSGRGNFRPGFHSDLNNKLNNNEPFFLLKRSSLSQQIPINKKTPFAMFDRPYFSDFARRR